MNILSGDVMPINIFISSRMKERSIEKERRDLAKEAIEELGDNFKPVLFEYEPPDSKHIKDWWRSRIKGENTKFMVLILNDTLSAAVFDEFRNASEYGVRTFVLLINEKFVLNEKLRTINYPESGLVISDDDLGWFYRAIKSQKIKEIKEEDEFKKDIRNAISQHLDVSPEVPHELKNNILSKDDPELKRILKVYVKPIEYDNAYSILDKNRFLVITGDANIGKTSMAQHLADRMRSEHNLARIIKIDEGRIDIGLFRNLKKSAIIFDDAFGKSNFGDSGDYSGNIDDIMGLRESNNFVILTTRKQILDEVKRRQTRFTEYYQNIKGNLKEFSQEGSYSDDALREILEKHLNYYYETGKISDGEVAIARENTGKIINNLRFPHNIDILVKEELKKATEGLKGLDDAIEAAKHIKIIAKSWFLNLEVNKKYFVFTVALFPIFAEKTFDRVYERITEALRRRHVGLTTEDPNALRMHTAAYITETGIIGFRHPNYWEGVREGILEECRRDLVDVFPALKELAKDNDSDVRWEVVGALRVIGMIKPYETLPVLKELAKDNDSRVRMAVTFALGMIGRVKPDEILPVLKELAKDKDSDVRWVVADALREMGKVKPDEILPVLKEQARDKDLDVRWGVAGALREMGKVKPDETLSVLNEWAKDNDSHVRETAANALGLIGENKPDETIPVLKELAKDNDLHVRMAVAGVLGLGMIGEIKPDETIPVLKELAKDKDSNVRGVVAVTIALRTIGKQDETIQVLKEWAKDKDSNARETAAHALGEIGEIKTDGTLPALKELAKDTNPGVRRAVANALGMIGKVKPDETIPVLKELAKDNDPDVRMAAEASLGKVPA